MLYVFRRWYNEGMKLQSGALVDTRGKKEKEKDFQFKEVVSAASPVNWMEKAGYRKFPIFNQNGSGSCVAQTEAKELGIMRWLKDGNYVHFSAADIYQRRSNKPQAGMGAVDARSSAKEGITLEVLSPSQNMTDATMDAVVIEPYKHEVGKVFAVPNYLELPARDIETVASTIQATGKGVMVWFYFKISEWTSQPKVLYPILDIQAFDTIRHSVTAVDWTLKDGKKCLVIEDSWGLAAGVNGQRIVDEDFFKARNWYAGYLINFIFDEPSNVPHYFFSKELLFGQTDPDIKALQDVLKYETFFPLNAESTGYYGAITAKGVLSFQKKYHVASDAELDMLAGKRVGSKTLTKLNSLYFNSL